MRKKILFIHPNLKAGGAERVIAFLSKNLDKDSFECKLLITGYKQDVVYDTEGVDISYLNKERFSKSIIPILKHLIIEKPNIVFTSISHVNLFMGFISFFFPKIKFVAREASILTARNKFVKNQRRVPDIFLQKIYPRLNKIVCQSIDMKDDLIENYNLELSRLEIINNPITFSGKVQPIYPTKSRDINFITVGRLSSIKGHSRILKGLSTINDYTFNYLIIGSGDLEENIKSEVELLGLDSKVQFIPYTNQVLEYLSGSDYFIQGSFVEAFPNALLESCSVGTPVLAFNCPGGTREIIQNDVNGYLVDDANHLEVVLSSLNEKSFDRSIVKKSVYDKYAADIIFNKYQNLFLKV